MYRYISAGISRHLPPVVYIYLEMVLASPHFCSFTSSAEKEIGITESQGTRRIPDA
jgi:hypothetical protein